MPPAVNKALADRPDRAPGGASGGREPSPDPPRHKNNEVLSGDTLRLAAGAFHIQSAYPKLVRDPNIRAGAELGQRHKRRACRGFIPYTFFSKIRLSRELLMSCAIPWQQSVSAVA